VSWECCGCVKRLKGLFFQEEAHGLGFGQKRMFGIYNYTFVTNFGLPMALIFLNGVM